MKKLLLNFWQGNKAFIVFICLMFVFRSSLADWNTVPTGSMKPTILEGYRIWVNKIAYDWKIPFTQYSLYRHAHPERGDIIVFESKAAQKRLVKRVIGVPGDTVALRNNVLFINGQALNYKETSDIRASRVQAGDTYDLEEDLLGLQHAIRITDNSSYISSFTEVTVPQNQYLALGDNRDNSADSRVIGFVPRDEIIGRTNHVVLSVNYDNFYLPRTDRFFHKL